jgi:hypothetical protein
VDKAESEKYLMVALCLSTPAAQWQNEGAARLQRQSGGDD